MVPPRLNLTAPIHTWGGQSHCASEVSSFRAQCTDPGHVLNPDNLIQSPALSLLTKLFVYLSVYTVISLLALQRTICHHRLKKYNRNPLQDLLTTLQFYRTLREAIMSTTINQMTQCSMMMTMI